MDIAFFLLLITTLSFLLHTALVGIVFFIPKNKLNTQTGSDENIRSVSILICARNEGQNLSKVIPGIMKQDFEKLHIVIVSHKSNDETDLLVQSYLENDNRIKYVKCDKEYDNLPGKRSAIWEGLQQISSDFVLLTDADCMPRSNNWTHLMISRAGATQSDVVLGISPYEKDATLVNELMQYETFHTAKLYIGAALHNLAYMGVGRNMLIKTSVLLENIKQSAIPGLLSGDDDLLISYIAPLAEMSVESDANAHVISRPKKTWLEYLRQKRRHMSTATHYRRHHRFILGMERALLFVAYLSIIPLFFSSYWMWAGLLYIWRYIILIISYRKNGRRLNISFNYFLLPLLEVLNLLVSFYAFVGSHFNRSWN